MGSGPIPGNPIPSPKLPTFLSLNSFWDETSRAWVSLGLETRRVISVKRSNQISRSVGSDSLRPHESQHARPPCPSPTPRVHWDSRPSSQWCCPAISSSVVPFSSCPQSLPASESFPRSQLFTSGGQSTGVSALASFLPKKSQGWSPSWVQMPVWVTQLQNDFSLFPYLADTSFWRVT